MVRLLPGDPIRAAMQSNVDLTDKSIVEDVRAQYGLDKPVPTQYYIWLTDFFKGNWGKSIGNGDQVLDMFLRRLPVTLELFLASLLWSWIIGFPLGVFSALKRNSVLDISFTSIAIFFVAAPSFWVAIMGIYLFAVILQWLPPSGYVPFFEDPVENLKCVLMPSFCMGIVSAGILARYVRSALLETLGLDFIRTARAKGFRGNAIITKHAAKPSLVPVVTIIGLGFSYMVAGNFIIEFMFAIPGIGRMGVEAIFGRDFPVIQAVMIASAVTVMLMNLIVDISYGYLDPRIRVQK
ncbi:MAG: ABC transporter permease [Proteobacteria bacterium]|nr:ABC transporter permease [Pseudomonadota bacterium]